VLISCRFNSIVHNHILRGLPGGQLQSFGSLYICERRIQVWSLQSSALTRWQKSHSCLTLMSEEGGLPPAWSRYWNTGQGTTHRVCIWDSVVQQHANTMSSLTWIRTTLSDYYYHDDLPRWCTGHHTSLSPPYLSDDIYHQLWFSNIFSCVVLWTEHGWVTDLLWRFLLRAPSRNHLTYLLLLQHVVCTVYSVDTVDSYVNFRPC